MYKYNDNDILVHNNIDGDDFYDEDDNLVCPLQKSYI